MTLKEKLEIGYTQGSVMRIVEYVGSDTERMSEIMQLFFEGEDKIQQRAAWSVGHIAEKNPQLFEPYLEKMLHFITEKPQKHGSIIRNTIRTLRELPEYPEHLCGMIADITFNYLQDPKIEIAIRAFSMRVFFKMCQYEPELLSEFKLLLEEGIQHETQPGYLSTANDILKKIKKNKFK